MPWKPEDSEQHSKGLGKKQSEIWANVANSVLQKCVDDGGEQKACEVKAITQANGVVKKATEQDEVESVEFDESGNVVVVFVQKDSYSAEMEVFSIGKWNGDDYTEKDLDQMVEAYSELKSMWKPFLKLGHGDKVHGFDQPALGYADVVRRVGGKLLATFVNIPKVVKDAIDKGLYAKRSAEVYWDYQMGGKKYPRVLKACALLGASVPAVTTLADIPRFFKDEGIEARTYIMDVKTANEDSSSRLFNNRDTDRRNGTMDYDVLLKEKEDKIQELQEKLLGYQSEKDAEKITEMTEAIETQQTEITQLKKFEQENKDLQAKVANAEKQLAEAAAREKRQDVEMFLKEYGVKGEGKILPRDEKLVEQILTECPEEKCFSVEGLNGKTSLADMVKEYIKRGGKKVDTREYSQHDKEGDAKRYVSASQEVDVKAKEYMVEKNEKSYSVAMKAVFSADPDLKLRYTGAKE